MKTKVEVGKLKKRWNETVSARETGSARTPLNVNHLGTVSAFLGTVFYQWIIKRLQQRFRRKSLHVKKVGYQSLSLPGQSPIHPHRDCGQSWPFTILKMTHRAKQKTVPILFVCSPRVVPCRPNLFFGTLFWILSYIGPIYL